MSWWAATVPANGEELVVGEDVCRVSITQVCLRKPEALPDGSVVTLLAKAQSSWVPVARLKTKMMEFAPVRLSVEPGEELSLKVSGAGELDVAGYQNLIEPAMMSSDEEGDMSDVSDEIPQASKRKAAEITGAAQEVPQKKKPAPVAKPDAATISKETTANKSTDGKSDKTVTSAKTAEQKAVAANVDFIASPKFTESKPGYVFKKGAKGLGYYKDTPPVVSSKTAGTSTKKSADAWADQVIAQREWKQMAHGLRYRDLVAGNPGGATPRRGQRVTVHYTGRLAKGGKQFDSSVGRKPFTFTYGGGEVIRGWDMGLDGMRVGGRRELEIPAALGYGARGAKPDIPGNATLMFEIQLLKC